MPAAYGGHVAQVKYHYQDHDTDVVNQAPPVQNTWYTVFDASDVRLLWCVIQQTNDETAAKDLEVRWTIDGNVYLVALSLDALTEAYIFRSHEPSTAGTDGLTDSADPRNGTFYCDKRGKAFKVEVRITSVVGTNQTLTCWCVRETLEAT